MSQVPKRTSATCHSYCRQSSNPTNNNYRNESIDVQLEKCTQERQKNYSHMRVNIVTETVSGLFERQLKLQDLLGKLKEGDILLVSEISRLTRDAQFMLYLANNRELSNKLVIKSVADGTIYNKLNFEELNVQIRIAEAFRKQKSEEAKERVIRRKRRGEHVGAVPYGKRVNGQRQLEDDPEAQELIRRVITLYNSREMALAYWNIDNELSLTQLVGNRLNELRFLKKGEEWTSRTVANFYKKFKDSVEFIPFCLGCPETDLPTVTCEKCDSAFHSRCVVIRKNCLMCHSCALVCEECGRDVEKKNPILICDGCEKGYHLGCLKIKKIPEKFHCGKCLTSEISNEMQVLTIQGGETRTESN